jgi:hypothetical protein
MALGGIAAILLIFYASPQDETLSEKEKSEGFRALFDGKSLDGWEGNARPWSVQDGVLVGEVSKDKPLFQDAFLSWKQGPLSDFELRFRFRLAGGGRAGLLYRGRDLGNDRFGGYYYELGSGPGNLGRLGEEKGKRGQLAWIGEKVVWTDRKKVEGATAEKDALAAAEKAGDWNEGAVVAKKNRIQHFLNGLLLTEFADEDDASRILRGPLALQLRGGTPVKVEFKSIRLREPGTNLGLPYDPARHEHTPFQRNPEIMSLVSRRDLWVVWRDFETAKEKTWKAGVLGIGKEGNVPVVRKAFEVDLIHTLMGFAADEQGNFYVATGILEGSENFPKPPVHRSDIVVILKYSPQGKLLQKMDVQKEMQKADPNATIIQEPGSHGWSSSRLACGNGTLHIVFGVSWTNGHQGACAAQLDAVTGKVVKLGSVYCSHTMDQRLSWDGDTFLEMQMGDAFPRAFVVGKHFRTKGSASYELFNPKGGRQQHSFCGNIVATSHPQFGYLANFSVEKSPGENSYHELAVVRVRGKFEGLDANPGAKKYVDASLEPYTVAAEGGPRTSYVKWMTDAAKDRMHVVKPKLVRVDLDRFLMLWERCAGEPGERLQGRGYKGTFGMVIDSNLKVVQPEKQVSEVPLVTADDGIFWEGKAVFVSGNAKGKTLRLSLVDKNLNGETVELPAYRY